MHRDGRDAEALMDEAVFTDDPLALSVAARADIAEIQRAIAAGEDPTEVAEPTAAGEGQGGPEESLEQADQVQRTGRVGLVEAGYETSGLEQDFDELLIDRIGFDSGDDDEAIRSDAVDSQPVAVADGRLDGKLRWTDRQRKAG